MATYWQLFTHFKSFNNEQKQLLISGNKTDEQICAGYKTCASCRSNPSCGWCDNGEGTGIGNCYLGGASGPLKKDKKGHSQVQWVPDDVCSAEDNKKSWHFTSCPGK